MGLEIAQHRAQRQPGLVSLRLIGAIDVRVRRVVNGPKARRTSSVSVHAAAPPPLRLNESWSVLLMEPRLRGRTRQAVQKLKRPLRAPHRLCSARKE